MEEFGWSVLISVSHVVGSEVGGAKAIKAPLGWTSKMAHSWDWHLILAVNWDLSWGFQLEYLLAVPPGAYVGFLTLWWLSFRSERPWRTRQMFYYLLWFRLRSYCHFCHSLKPVQIQGDGKSCQSCIVKRACGIGDPVVGIYE